MTVVSLRLEQFKAANDLSDVAKIWNIKPARLSYPLYHLSDALKYTEFTVPKKSGGVRTIAAPAGQLKYIQKLLAKDLAVIELQLESKRAKRNCILAHGFKKTLSIMTNGHNHRSRRYVFNVDIKDFFPSINFGRVYGFFLKNADFELKPKVAAVLAQIACHNNQLPQGSPCSPAISNLIAHILDLRLNELAQRFNCTYTRYADDLTFSTNEKLFPQQIGKAVPGTLNQWEAGSKLVAAIKRAGFELNSSKTRMQFNHSRQDVTGLVVNQKVNIPSDYYATVSAMCDKLFKQGECHINVNGVAKPFPRQKLRGRLAFIYQVRGMGPKGGKLAKVKDEVDEEEDEAAKKKKKKAKHVSPPRSETIWASFKLYERFLNYANLYGATRTVLLCEGITDNIYIKSAIQRLAPKYPTLIDGGANANLKISLFRYTKTTAIVQQLSGGSGQLSKLAFTYASRVKGFKSGAKHPLILIADFDEGSEELFKTVKSKTGKEVDGSEPWYFLYKNLYVVPIPKQGTGPTAIEDLFEKSVLEEVFEGKMFDRKGVEKDGSKVYSKATFAKKIVANKKASISFVNFEPLLDAIVAVELDYAKRIAGKAAPTAAAAA